jgi:hypothetical protein
VAVRPKGVKQNNNWGCWAACMESWTSSVSYWSSVLQEELARKYGGAQDSLDTGSDAFARFIGEYGLGVAKYEAGQLDLSTVAAILFQPWNYCMVFEQELPNCSHARLIYQVRRDTLIDVMEPRTGQWTSLTASNLKKALLLSPALA